MSSGVPSKRSAQRCRWRAASRAMAAGHSLSLRAAALKSRVGLRNQKFATDSPLEGTGFEPSVPLLRKALLGLPIGDGGMKGGAITGSGPKRQCLPGVAAHSLSLRGGTASSNPSSSAGESTMGPGTKPIEKPYVAAPRCALRCPRSSPSRVRRPSVDNDRLGRGVPTGSCFLRTQSLRQVLTARESTHKS